jgi:hypothetical protein
MVCPERLERQRPPKRRTAVFDLPLMKGSETVEPDQYAEER